MANAITSQQWQEIEEKLNKDLIVTFLLDDEKIIVKKEYLKNMQLTLFVYINGEIKGVWNEENKPIIRKVWFLKTKRAYSYSRKRELIRQLGKKRAYELVDLDDKIEHLIPWFSSFRTLKSQYEKLEGLSYVG